MTAKIEQLYAGPMDGLEVPDEDQDELTFHVAPDMALKMGLCPGSHLYLRNPATQRLEFSKTLTYGSKIH